MIFPSALEIMVPLVIAALGGLVSERAGILNIAIEGLMIIGAFVGVATATLVGALVPGLMAAAMVSGCAAGFLAFFTLRFRANGFVTGVAMNLFAAGIIPVLSELVFSTRGVLRLRLHGDTVVLSQAAAVTTAAVLVVATAYLLFRTRYGIRLRTLRQGSEVLAGRGFAADWYRGSAMAVSGLFAGLAGAMLAMRIGVYFPNITAGRGWIALVIVFLGNSNPFGVLIAAAVFAVSETMAAQAQGISDSPALLLGVPYFLTIGALVVFEIVKRRNRR